MRKFLCALTFLTRIPVPAKVELSIDDFRSSIYYFPLIGLLLGGILGGCWFLIKDAFSPVVTGALILALHVFLTGGLHLDGFMDTLDGVLGGQTRERKLEIMKDSHVGAFGVIGVAAILILKFSIYAGLNRSLLPLLVFAPVAGRQVLVWLQIMYPYARQQGVGSLFTVYRDFPKLIVTTLFTIAVAVLLLKSAGIILLFITAVFIFMVAGALSRLLGGLTGDTYGASCELAEVFALLAGTLLMGRHLL